MAEEKKAKKTAEKTSDKKADKKSKDKKKRTNPFKAIGSFFKSVRSEGKKVTWPKAKEVWKNTLVVVICILISGLIIFGVDRLLSDGIMANIKKAAQNRTTTTTAAETTEEPTTAEALEASTEPADTAETEPAAE